MESFRKLLSRIEQYLAKITELGSDLPQKALSRVELYLAYINGENVELPEKPLSRIEELLSQIAESRETTNPDLLSRVEEYLNGLLDDDAEIPKKALSEVEKYLEIWNNSKTDVLPEGYKRLVGLKFNANCYYEFTGFKLRGSDTVRFSFSVDKACNVFGCYTTTSADDNYSLYASTTEGAKYLRYNGGTYASGFKSAELGIRYDVIITPTGSSGFPRNDNWTEVDFEAPVDMLFGSTSTGATSSKFDGNLYGALIVDGRLNAIPVENEYGVLGFYDSYSKTFYPPTVGTPDSLGYA